MSFLLFSISNDYPPHGLRKQSGFWTHAAKCHELNGVIAMSRCKEPINTEHCNYEQTPASLALHPTQHCGQVERGKMRK